MRWLIAVLSCIFIRLRQNTTAFSPMKCFAFQGTVVECGLKAVALRRIPPLKRQARITPKHAQKISKKSSSGDARGQLERYHGLARGAP